MSKKEKPGKGSFCIPVTAANKFVEFDVSVVAICTYLVIAAFTDAAGTHSPAGATAVSDRLAK